ncbi:MAG: type II toxin-antitoxin system RelE/ParE family toxin [Pseudomonadota bacterium]
MKVKFYVTSSGRSPVEEFFQEQSVDLRSDFLDAVNLLTGGRPLGMPVNRNLSAIHHGLNELRLKDRTGHVRVLYFIKKAEAVYVLHAFRKRTQKLPQREIDVALRRIREV